MTLLNYTQHTYKEFCFKFYANILDAHIQKEDILCLGISCQRSTFITWDKETGKTFHDLITWKDMRSEELVNNWNKSVTSKVMFSFEILLNLSYNFNISVFQCGVFNTAHNDKKKSIQARKYFQVNNESCKLLNNS
jgi:glycerol kinase